MLERRLFFAGLIGLAAVPAISKTRNPGVRYIAGEAIEAGDEIRFGANARVYPAAVLKYEGAEPVSEGIATTSALAGDHVWVQV